MSADYVNALLDTACAAGADRAELVLRAGLQGEPLTDSAWRLEVTALLRLFDNARELSGDDLIGLHMGMQVRTRTFGALGYAAMGCRNLGEAVMLIPRYESLVYDGGVTTVQSCDGQVCIGWQSGLADRTRMRPINEAIVAGWLSFARWITGVRGELRAVRFQHARPKVLGDYVSFFGCPVQFDAADNALLFDLDLLALPLTQSDDQLRALMEQQAQARIRDIHTTALAPRVLAIMRQKLPKGVPAVGEIAQGLGMSERSLRRHLQKEGQSFADLLGQLRQELVLHYLGDPALGLLEVALLLGYAEQSSFTAAFKTWYGMPPGEYREACLMLAPR